jgi:hypothetical protein
METTPAPSLEMDKEEGKSEDAWKDNRTRTKKAALFKSGLYLVCAVSKRGRYGSIVIERSCVLD